MLANPELLNVADDYREILEAKEQLAADKRQEAQQVEEAA